MVIETRYQTRITIYSFDTWFIRQMWNQFKLGRMFGQPIYGYFNLTDEEINEMMYYAGPMTFSVRMSVPNSFFYWLISYMSGSGLSYSVMLEMDDGKILSCTDSVICVLPQEN